MNLNINNHISLLRHDDIAQICRPLEKLNITYFGHANINNAGELSAITNGPDFFRHYFSNEYYNVDIHAAKSDLITKYCIWDAIELTGESAKMDQEAAEFGIRHTFTIAAQGENERDYYHFSTNMNDKSINQTYLENMDLLNIFIMHFKEKVQQSKILSSAYNMKFSLDQDKGQFQAEGVNDHVNQKLLRENFLEEIKLDKQIISHMGASLSRREIDILAWLHYGKTANDIANILGIAEVSVNKRIASIKSKFKCYTQFQLGEHFSSLFLNSGEVIENLIKSRLG